MDTSAPVSIRYCVFECASVMNKRLEFGMPTSSAAFDEAGGSFSFLARCKARGISERRGRTFGDTNSGRRLRRRCHYLVLV